ncbi:hypothetical protein Bca4012_089777 [Brassica carinata]
MSMSIPVISSAAHAKVLRFFFRQVTSSVLKGSQRLAPISTHRSGDASSRQTVTTVSICTLATSISRIVSLLTRRSFRGLARSTVAPPLNEMTFAHVESCISFLIVEWLFRVRLIRTPPPSF